MIADNGITISNLSKSFSSKRFGGIKDLFSFHKKSETISACDQIDLNVKRGNLLCLVGPNGSGKTTLLRILSGIILPDSGSVRISGTDVVRNALEAKSFVSVVFSENRNFYLRLTGRENLKFFGTFYGLSFVQTEKRIGELTDLLKMGEYLDQMFQEYSSGIKQRFAVARALLADAPILLLDEPTKNLDPIIAGAVACFVKETLVRKGGKTVIWTSHTFSEVAEIADYIAILDKGKIKAIGTLEELQIKTAGKAKDFKEIYRFYASR